jgi:membrane fusion protein (multidrug efflux system)
VQSTGERFTGKVSRLTGALDPSTRTEQVEIDVPNQKLHLAPGMFADVVLQIDKHDSALLVPVQAVNRAGDQSSALVVGSDNRVEVRPIRTGLEDANSAEVVSGLKEGDRVIVANLGSYQNGQMVDPRVSVFNFEAANGGAH